MAEDPKLDKIAIKDRRLAKIATVLAIAALVVLCLCAPTIIGFLAEELLKIVCWCIKTPVMLIFNVLTGRGVTF